MAMYFAVGSMWVYYIYWCFGNVFFGPGKMPGVSDVFEQIRVRSRLSLPAHTSLFFDGPLPLHAPYLESVSIPLLMKFCAACWRTRDARNVGNCSPRRGIFNSCKKNIIYAARSDHCSILWAQVAMGSMPLYAMLPALTEAVVEKGWTRVYSRIDDVGLTWYLVYFVLYMTSVEFFVYWMHRSLHDVKLGYRCALSRHFAHPPILSINERGGTPLILAARLVHLCMAEVPLLSVSDGVFPCARTEAVAGVAFDYLMGCYCNAGGFTTRTTNIIRSTHYRHLLGWLSTHLMASCR
jgi:hypothetical protein